MSEVVNVLSSVIVKIVVPLIAVVSKVEAGEVVVKVVVPEVDVSVVVPEVVAVVAVE